MSPVRILLDGWGLTSAQIGGGISRDALSIKRELEKNYSVEIMGNTRGIFNFLCGTGNFLMLNIKVRTLLNRPTDILTECDIFWSSQPNGVINTKAKRSVTRIHDLFPITHPEWFNKYSAVRFRNAIQFAVNKNHFFVCNSNTTAGELIQLFEIERNRVYVVPCEVSTLKNLQCNACSGCSYLEVPYPDYALAVGTVEPRKNYQFLLKIFNSGEVSSPLVVVGRIGWKSKKIMSLLQKSPKITCLTSCCDGALNNIYLGASSFVSASLNEGFDIAAFEAKCYGLPSVLSDIPVHREFYEEDLLFTLDDSAPWIEKLKTGTENKFCSTGKMYDGTVLQFKRALNQVVEDLNDNS